MNKYVYNYQIHSIFVFFIPRGRILFIDGYVANYPKFSDLKQWHYFFQFYGLPEWFPAGLA